MKRSLWVFVFLSMCCAVAFSGCGTGNEAETSSVKTGTTSTTVDTSIQDAQAEKQHREDQLARFYAEVDRQNQVKWFIAVAEHQEAVRAEAARAEAQRIREEAERKAKAAVPAPSRATPAPTQGTGRCGGDLPPCYVMMRESGGNITAQNPTSTASGKWQFLDSTWDGFGGYAKARYAPESVQDARARQLWAGGAGCSHWNAC